MKKYFTTVLLSLLFLTSNRAQLIDFEEFNLAPESEWNGSDLSASGFSSKGIYFPTFWDTSFGGYWASGFAYTNRTDSITSGFLNMYSAKAGSGYNGSDNYAVAYGNQFIRRNGGAVFTPISAYITNTTYAFNSMRDGDSFAKKFGGVDGTDPDFFSLTFKSYLGSQLSGEVTFYLADFRSSNSDEDYIIRDWTLVDLAPLGNVVDSISYEFASSDVGNFGINTPLYFAIDQLTVDTLVASLPSVSASTVNVFPNPANGLVHIQSSSPIQMAEILAVDGKVIRRADKQNTMDVSDLANGLYWVRTVFTDGRIRTNKVVVQH